MAFRGFAVFLGGAFCGGTALEVRFRDGHLSFQSGKVDAAFDPIADRPHVLPDWTRGSFIV